MDPARIDMSKQKVAVYMSANTCEPVEMRMREEPSNQTSGSAQNKPDLGNDGKEQLKANADNCPALRKNREGEAIASFAWYP